MREGVWGCVVGCGEGGEGPSVPRKQGCSVVAGVGWAKGEEGLGGAGAGRAGPESVGRSVGGREQCGG